MFGTYDRIGSRLCENSNRSSFWQLQMSPEAPIVDYRPFYAVGFLRTIDKSEFLHSLGR